MVAQHPHADRQLLAAFVERRDEAAFAELVRRHGPLVAGVCRRVLADASESDDAYQATFLALARGAGQVRDPGRLSAWLYGVAVRSARRARRARAVRHARERPMPDLPAREVAADWCDVRELLDAEIDRLPAKLKTALILCELQGVARDRAAAQLNIPDGTLSSRLARAKDELRRRLTRRGVTLSAAGLAPLFTPASAPALGPPTPLALELVHKETTMLLGSTLSKWLLLVATAVGLTLVGVALVPADKPDAVAAEKEKLKGEWVITDLQLGFDGVDEKDRKNIVGQTATFTADTFTVRGDAQQPRSHTYVLRPGESPKQIDLPMRGSDDVCEGVYELDGDKLKVHYVSKAADGRPIDFVMKKGGRSILMVLERKKPDPVAAEKAKLKGTWVVTDLQGGDGTAADEKERKQIVGKTATIDADTFTMRGPAKYDLRPNESPKQIDIFADKPAETLVGIYELDGDKLKLHFGGVGPQGANGRPVDFVAKPKGCTMLMVLERAKAKGVPAADAGAGKLSGNVRLDGQPAAGRVTVFVNDRQFVGSLVVGGGYAVEGVPAGMHRVEVLCEVGDFKQTIAEDVRFEAGRTVAKDFAFKK